MGIKWCLKKIYNKQHAHFNVIRWDYSHNLSSVAIIKVEATLRTYCSPSLAIMIIVHMVVVIIIIRMVIRPALTFAAGSSSCRCCIAKVIADTPSLVIRPSLRTTAELKSSNYLAVRHRKRVAVGAVLP